MTKALIRAGKWLDAVDASGNFINREEACRILSQKNYVGADFDVLKNSMTGYFFFQKTDKRAMPDFNVFFKYHATYPWYSDGIWFLTQMRRWGQITEPKSAEWYHETIKEVYLPDVYLAAAQLLSKKVTSLRKKCLGIPTAISLPTDDFIDGITYDGKDPIGYLNSHKIGNKDFL